MKKEPAKNTATVLVIFGATGDLMRKKVIPVIYDLYCRKKLPRLFRVVAYSRDAISPGQYRKMIREMLMGNKLLKLRAEVVPEFLALFEYHQGFFEENSCYLDIEKSLEAVDQKWQVSANKLFYLAAPPRFYEVIAKNLAGSGLVPKCVRKGGWVRLLMEKPFGRDLPSARALDRLLKKIFTEEQIYRIDHYLAKEMVQNILSFRFANNLLEKSWNNRFIEKIELRLWEKIGVEDRGAFFDHLGAFLDVGENHLLQLLSLITMERPAVFTATEIRKKRAEILAQLEIPTLSKVKTGTVRAQYEGYRQIPGVEKNSSTETYFKIIGRLKAAKWKGVPVILESGKRIKDVRKEIVVTFSHPMPCLCSLSDIFHHKNRIIFSLEPKQSIFIEMWAKKPGVKFDTEKRNLEFFLHKGKRKGQYVAEYEKILLDVLSGDQALFVSHPENEASWKFADPIRRAWNRGAVPLEKYAPDTLEIIQKTAALEETLVSDEEKHYFEAQLKSSKKK
jgi:glucose-6-phosphate 1-dehydrogenase